MTLNPTHFKKLQTLVDSNQDVCCVKTTVLEELLNCCKERHIMEEDYTFDGVCQISGCEKHLLKIGGAAAFAIYNGCKHETAAAADRECALYFICNMKCPVKNSDTVKTFSSADDTINYYGAETAFETMQNAAKCLEGLDHSLQLVAVLRCGTVVPFLNPGLPF